MFYFAIEKSTFHHFIILIHIFSYLLSEFVAYYIPIRIIEIHKKLKHIKLNIFRTRYGIQYLMRWQITYKIKISCPLRRPK